MDALTETLHKWLRELIGTVRSTRAARALDHPEILGQIEEALKKYGNLPNEFPEKFSVEDY